MITETIIDDGRSDSLGEWNNIGDGGTDAVEGWGGLRASPITAGCSR